MLDGLTSDEVTELLVFDSLEPLDRFASDLRAAKTALVTARAAGIRSPWEDFAEFFLPTDDVEGEQTTEEMDLAMMKIAGLFGKGDRE